MTNLRHGHVLKHRSPTYYSWSSMVTRCTNANAPDYPYYGGRGIGICDRWKLFDNFLLDMGPRPKGTTLDRYPNNSGDYEPTNCRWATVEQQNRNRRDNKLAKYGTRILCLKDWAKITKINYNTFLSRIRRGWTIARCIETPIGNNHGKN
jgi:hypothetical protein